MTVLIRVDAGAGIGLGHLQRCLSLAAALEQRGVATELLVAGDAAGLARAHALGARARLLEAAPGSIDDADETFAAAQRCEAIVVDSYAVGAGYLERLAAAGSRVTAIDDLAEHAFPCGLVVNGGAHAGDLVYDAPGARLLLGPRYALLRPEFHAPRAQAHRDGRHVLVTMGGADLGGLTAAIVEGADSLPVDAVLTVVVGPLADGAAIAAAARRSPRRVDLVAAPTEVASLMAAADVALSAGGQTLYELAAVGTPAVAVEVAANQAGNIAALARSGSVVAAGPAGDPATVPRLLTEASRLLGAPEERVRRSLAGRRLVDGRGALRVAAAVCELAGARAPTPRC